MAQLVKNLPAMQETWVRSLGLKDPLEKGMATHSSILSWRNPWMEEPDGLLSMGCKELDTTEQLTLLLSLINFQQSIIHLATLCINSATAFTEGI